MLYKTVQRKNNNRNRQLCSAGLQSAVCSKHERHCHVEINYISLPIYRIKSKFVIIHTKNQLSIYMHIIPITNILYISVPSSKFKDSLLAIWLLSLHKTRSISAHITFYNTGTATCRITINADRHPRLLYVPSTPTTKNSTLLCVELMLFFGGTTILHVGGEGEGENVDCVGLRM